MLTEKQLASQLGMSVYTLRKWRCTNRGPQFIRLERLVRYRQQDVDAWVDARTEGGDSSVR